MKIIRLLSWYDNKSDSLIGEIVLENIEVEVLRKLFNPSKEDPMVYMVYEVTKENISGVQQLTSHKIEIDKYTYFVEAYQDI